MPYIENSLAYIFEISLESSKFRDDWKTARATLFFKITSLYQSYQFYLNCLGNLYLINCTNVVTTMVCIVLISLAQDGYIPLYPFHLKLLIIGIRGWIQIKCSVWYFVDLQKAFDTFDYRILCIQLTLYGVR